MKDNKVICYTYRGTVYQKSSPHKISINLLQNQSNKSSRDFGNPTLIYRGVSYQIQEKKHPANFTTSVYVKTYRGINHLTCIAELQSDYKLNKLPDFQEKPTNKQV